MSKMVLYHHSSFTYIHLNSVLVSFSEELLKVEGMDIKFEEPITAAHLIDAARLGNSKADAVLNKGQSTKQAHTQI